MKYKGSHISGKTVEIYQEKNRFFYQAEYGSGAAKDVEVAKMLAMIESFPPSERVDGNKQKAEILKWTWKN